MITSPRKLPAPVFPGPGAGTPGTSSAPVGDVPGPLAPGPSAGTAAGGPGSTPRAAVAAHPAAARGSGPRTWTIEMPAGMKLLSLNDRLHWRERNRRSQEIKKAAWALAVQVKIPPLARIAVIGEYQPPDRRKRDEDNLTISIKSAIDGIKAAGVVADDSSGYVRYDGCRIGERYPKGRLIITVTEVPG